jgi:hypothetical protein
MSETNAYPTEDQVLLIRADLTRLLAPERTLEDEMQESLKECKRILEDKRKVVWSRVFVASDSGGDYLDNPDSTGRNEDRIKNAISNMTAAIIFRGYSVLNSSDERWSSLADYYYDMAYSRLVDSVLDIDLDDSGTIDDDEAGRSGQPFFRK